jgi:hypothetical protein
VELNQGLEMDITAIEVSERNMDIGEMWKDVNSRDMIPCKSCKRSTMTEEYRRSLRRCERFADAAGQLGRRVFQNTPDGQLSGIRGTICRPGFKIPGEGNRRHNPIGQYHRMMPRHSAHYENARDTPPKRNFSMEFNGTDSQKAIFPGALRFGVLPTAD